MKDFSEILKIIIMLSCLFALFSVSADYKERKDKFENVIELGDTLYLNNEARVITFIDILDNKIYLDNGAIVNGEYVLKMKINGLK